MQGFNARNVGSFGSALSSENQPTAHSFGYSHAQPSQATPAQPIGVQWRPKEPPTFFGRASEDTDTWVSIVSNYFAFMVGTPQQEVAYAATLLRDTTHDWWTAYLCRQHGHMPHD